MKILIIWLTISGFYLEDTFNDPTGSYELDSKVVTRDDETFGYFGEIQVKQISQNLIIITFYINKGAPSYNSGSFVDTLEIQNNIAEYINDEDIACKITFKFEKDGINVIQEVEELISFCGEFGYGVNVDGYFKRISSEVPILKDPITDELLDSIKK